MAKIYTPRGIIDTEIKIHHSEVDRIISRVGKEAASVESFTRLYNDLKPYAERGLCKVVLVKRTDSVQNIMTMAEIEGYDPIQFYNIFKVPSLQKGIFADTMMILIFKKKTDILESQLTTGLNMDL